MNLLFDARQLANLIRQLALLHHQLISLHLFMTLLQHARVNRLLLVRGEPGQGRRLINRAV